MKTRTKNLFFWIRALLIAVVGVLLLQLFAFNSCYIPSSGMENSLFCGDRIIVNKWAYGLRLPGMSIFGYQRLAESDIHKNDIVVFNNPHSPSTATPTESRAVYISRCMGLPADTLRVNAQYAIVSQREEVNPDHKQLYIYPREQDNTIKTLIKQLGIEGNELMGQNKEGFVRSFSRYEIYLLKQETSNIMLKSIQPDSCTQTYPLIVPRGGMNIHVDSHNVQIIKNTINEHEGKKAFILHDSILYVNGRRVSSYVFTKDYYWMVSNNSVNISDSRRFGFVPKDHVIGKAALVWFSKDPQTSPFNGFRWKRFFQPVQ